MQLSRWEEPEVAGRCDPGCDHHSCLLITFGCATCLSTKRDADLSTVGRLPARRHFHVHSVVLGGSHREAEAVAPDGNTSSSKLVGLSALPLHIVACFGWHDGVASTGHAAMSPVHPSLP